MKVLIVEDEYYTRKALVKMVKDWSEEAEITDDVENGRLAIESIEKQMPDVIITDIRMPVLDGLELCKYVKNKYPDLFLAIISGYAEFEYAHKAIVYNVRDYLLKPLNKENLFKMLDKCRSDLINLREKDLEHDLVRQNSDLLRASKAIDNILYGRNSDVTGFREIFQLEREPAEFVAGIIEAQVITEELLNAAIHMRSENAFPFYHSKNRIGIIYAFFEKTHESAIDEVAFNLKKNISGLADKFSCSISAGISDKYHSLCELPAAFREAEQAMNYRLIHGWDKVYEYNKNKEKSPDTCIFNQEMLRSFRFYLESGEKEAAGLLARTAFLKFLDNTDLSVSCLQQLYLKIIAVINDLYSVLAEWSPENSRYADIFEISSFHTMDDLIEYVSVNISNVCDGLQNMNPGKRESIVDSLKNFVLENYNTDIVLEELAEKRYFLHVSYLSRIFKAAVGESFSKYLLRVRMEKAKKLIAEGNMKISDIAGFVGYNSASHFVQEFRKFYGMTPGEYKKLCQ